MEYIEYLRAHKDCTQKDLDYVKSTNIFKIENSCDENDKKIRNMIRQVQGEIHRMHAFIRLEQSNNILHAYAKFEHDIGLEVAKKLARRTPDMIIILGDENRGYKAIYTNSKYYAQKLADYKTTLKNFGIEKTESQIKKLWENYYWSQYAKSRTNLKLFRKHVPKKIFENTECELSRCESEICRAKQTKLF